MWVGGCSDPRQLPPKLSRVPLPEGHPRVPLSVCPSAPLLWHSHPTCKAPASPVPDICTTRGVPCQPAAPCRGSIHTMLRGNRKPRDPALGCAPVSSPSLLCSHGGQDLPEQDPHRLGKSKAHGAQAAFTPWAASGSVQAAIPLAFHSRARGTRGSDGHAPPGPFLPRCSHAGACPGLHPQALQPPLHPHRLHPAMASWMRWALSCWGIANGDWPGVPGQGSLALTP